MTAAGGKNDARAPVVIIGAGIVGVSAAIYLQRDGRDVVLIDRAGPGEGASYGNGGVLASCSVVPVTVPGLIRKAPSMLLDPVQPLFLRWSYLPRLTPWLVRYLRHCTLADAGRVAAALAPLVGDSLADHQALAEDTGAEKWVKPADYLFLYRDRDHFRKNAFGWSLRREMGFRWDELEGEAFHDYDPAFAPGLDFAARVAGHGFIADPGRYVKDLAAHVENNGGRILRAEVADFVREGGRVKGVVANGEAIACSAVIVATGAWSKPLARKLGVNVPLESERGYHLELWEPNITPKAPVMIASGKFVATPMDGRLNSPASSNSVGSRRRHPQRPSNFCARTSTPQSPASAGKPKRPGWDTGLRRQIQSQ